MTRGRGMIERSASTGVTCSTSSPPVLPSALLVDCDGVRVDTDKYGHRISFNDSFGELVNMIHFNICVMRMTAYFNKTGWPENAPKSEEEGKEFIASLHKRKTELFIALIEKRLLPLWPGFSNSFMLAGTRASRKIKIFAGDVVPSKKLDPGIYVLAAKMLGVDPSSYTVVEEDFLNADAVFDCIRDSPEERFDLAFFVRLLEKQYVRP
ncbi:haloacid dehalogenase-like hydrolase domain-containing protein [Tripterygium wilfordii]|uniref:Haloacid dehalogenase-like hydrolase domain-containing protein n=1 Tax=Tripterygium wilfordii TaxID=458696 RepID=A0A7J7CB00_TRIWF|nr:haloacid dehalogenase-like hydrolase domain-containing protein [Tripterygium wilfordii]